MAASCLPDPAQPLAVLAALPKKPAAWLCRWEDVAGTAAAGLWVRWELGRALCGSKSWGLRALGEVGPRGMWPQRLEGVVSGSSAADPWLETPGTAAGSLPSPACSGVWGWKSTASSEASGSPKTQCERGSGEIHGAAGGAGCPVSLFLQLPAAPSL